MTRREQMRGDDGVSLVLAMVFMVVVGLFVTVALDKNQAVSLSGQSVGSRLQLQYALDGGVDRTLQRLKAEVGSGSPTNCLSTSTADGQGTLSLNGQSTRWSCRTLAGRTTNSGDATVTNFALLTTSTATGALTTQSGVAQDLNVSGSVYLNAPVTNGDVGKPVEITDGDLVLPDGASCQADLDALTRVRLTGTGQLRSCTTQTLAQALPTVALPSPPTLDLSVTPVSATATATVGEGVVVTSGTRSCTVFLPGRYTKPPTLANNSDNYFVSGLYYFDFPSSNRTWTVDDAGTRVQGGARGLSTDTSTPSTDCSTLGIDDATALTLPLLGAGKAAATPYLYPYGATWVFGGESGLDVKKGSLTLFSPPVNGSTVPVNLVGASAYTNAGYTSQPLATPLLKGGGNQASMQVNAKIFAPNSRVEVFSTNGTVAAARGGVVGHEIELKASAAGSDALVVSAGSQGNPPPPFRTVLVETRDDSGTSTASNRAVATIGNFAPFSVKVRSWRTD